LVQEARCFRLIVLALAAALTVPGCGSNGGDSGSAAIAPSGQLDITYGGRKCGLQRRDGRGETGLGWAPVSAFGTNGVVALELRSGIRASLATDGVGRLYARGESVAICPVPALYVSPTYSVYRLSG
jgi:hypothetical protein